MNIKRIIILIIILTRLCPSLQNSSDLPTLTQILCATFAEHCPVYSKRNVPQQQQPTPQSGGWGQPNRPVQPPSTYATPSNFPTPQPYGNTPPRGPYPGALNLNYCEACGRGKEYCTRIFCSISRKVDPLRSNYCVLTRIVITSTIV